MTDLGVDIQLATKNGQPMKNENETVLQAHKSYATYQFSGESPSFQFPPLTEPKKADIFVRLTTWLVNEIFRPTASTTHIDTLLPQSVKNGVRAARNGSILTLEDDAHSTCITMVNWESEPRQERYHNASPPRSAFLMGTNNAAD